MRKVESVIRTILPLIKDKELLEVACGGAAFSAEASKHCKKVTATDISDVRIKKHNYEKTYLNMEFVKMDAVDLLYDDRSFDITVCYNAIAHLADVLDKSLLEMSRVTRKNGFVIIISTWKLDLQYFAQVEKILAQIPSLKLFKKIRNKDYSVLLYKKDLAAFQ